MLARSIAIADRFMTPPAPFVAGRWRVPRLTRADAQAMVRLGIIPEDASTELLNGLIVLKDRSAQDQDPTMIGQDHRKCVERLSQLRARIDDQRRHVESQQPLVCSDTHQPEPDFMIPRGTLDQYQDLATATDAFCVIEVADSSYERDAGEKLAGYARAGIGQYIIINLRNRSAEVYVQPDAEHAIYAPPHVVRDGGSVALRVGADEMLSVSLGELLP